MALKDWLHRTMGGKSEDARRFETLNQRLIWLQEKLTRIRNSQHEQEVLSHERFTELFQLLQGIDRKADGRMSELSDAVAAIANDVTELQAAGQRVIDLLSQPNPDVAAAIAALRTADAGFDVIRDALNAAGTAPTPEEPPVEPPAEA